MTRPPVSGDDDGLDPPQPASKVRRFEGVTVINTRMGEEWVGRRGVAIWSDPPSFGLRTRTWGEWLYVVYFSDIDCYRSFKESDLEPSGMLDPEEAHLGQGYEISFDCVLAEDHMFVEGCYRRPGRHWAVFVFDKTGPSGRGSEFLAFRHSPEETWRSGVTGIEFEVPRSVVLNRDFMVKALADVFGTDGWVEVRGPDSLILK